MKSLFFSVVFLVFIQKYFETSFGTVAKYFNWELNLNFQKKKRETLPGILSVLLLTTLDKAIILNLRYGDCIACVHLFEISPHV